MALLCPSREDSERRRAVIGTLKCLVDSIVEKEGPVPLKMSTPPCCKCCCGPPHCPACPQSTLKISPKPQVPCPPPDLMVCYRVKKCNKPDAADQKAKKDAKEGTSVKPSKSRELRAGILYYGCDCEKLNGLQDDCRRTGCHGSPECLAKPQPICGPSEFSNAKHLRKKGKFAEKSGASGGGAGGKEGGDDSFEYQCFPAALEEICPCTG